MQIEGLWCTGPGCAFTLPTAEAAAAAGWQEVGGEWFCACHGAPAVMKARRVAELAELRLKAEQRAARNQDTAAKQGFTTEQYAAWADFQQGLVNFHRKHGKLAPAPLRLLAPKTWLAIHEREGAIDVEQAVQKLETAEKNSQAARERLTWRVQ